MNVDRAFGDADLRHVVIEIQDGERGVAAEADGCGAEPYLDERILIGPEFVADGDRPIHFCRAPNLRCPLVEMKRSRWT